MTTRCGWENSHHLVAFVGDVSYPWIRRRFEGFRQAMGERRLKPIAFTTGRAASFVQFGELSAARILARSPRPTAVVAGNDEIAYGVWRSLRRQGARVPEDVSLTGFDDREEAVLMDPPLSTVRVYKEEIGQACMKMLLERLHHPQMAVSHRVLPTELVIRGTVKSLSPVK